MPHLFRYFLLLVFVFSFTTRVHAQWVGENPSPLPRFETEEEKHLSRTYVPPSGVATLPPAHPVRTMAEFEESEGIIVRWAYNEQNLLLSQIVDAAQEEGNVWIITRPGTSDSTNIKSYLQSRNIPLTNISFFPISTNTIWCRDYGPWTVYDVTNDSIGLVDFRYNRPRPLDDVVPVALSTRWDVPLYQTLQMPDSLVHTGGNFMVDGFGTGFASELILAENPQLTPVQVDSTLARYCGLHRLVTMTQLPFDVIHHIDMHMKLLDEETLLIGQYPVNRADYAVIENTVAYLATLLNCYGRHYRIIRIPMPPDASGRYPDNGSNYLTYTNSLIINKTVLVPIYSLPTDQQALQVYRDAMPGYTVISYDCNAIIPQLGAIHCITKEIGVREPLHISHAYLTNTSDTVNDYRVSMKVSARSGIDSAGIFWRTDTTTNFTSIAMVDSSGIYVGYLPHQSYGKSIWYYLSATSGSGRTVSKPLVGPLGAFRFDIGDTTLTSAPEQTFPQTVRLFQNYPNPFNPVTTIRYTIPSSAHVQIKVYNLVGQEIETLYQGDSMAGSYSVIFDASKYASGVYFFRLSAFEKNGRSSVQIQKGLLLK